MNESKLIQRRIQIPSSAGEGASAAAPGQSGSFSLLAFVEPFFANKRILILSVLGSMLLGWLALLVWPRSYDSEARLLVRVGRESVSLDPTATTSETMLLQKTQEEEINSVLEVMSSRTISEKTVEALGAGPILDGYLPGEGIEQGYFEALGDRVKETVSDTLYTVLVAAGLKDELSDRELAVMELQDTVGIYARKMSTVIIVKASSKSPQMAQAVSQGIVDTYLTEHLRTSGTEGSQLFFETQAAAAEEELNELLDRRTAMLQDRDIESIDSSRNALLSTLTDLETTVRGRLNSLELEEVQLASKVTENHPDFIRLRRELDETRLTVRAMQIDKNRKDAVVLETAMLLDRASSGRQTGSAALRLLDQKRRIQKELGELMSFQLEMDDVERSIGVSRDRLDKLRQKQEEARLIDELQSKRISNISIVQPASFVERPAAPNKKLLGVGFAGLGFMAGVGLIILREMNSTTIRSTHQLGDLREDLLVVDLPSRKGVFKRFNADKNGARWKTPVMRSQLGQVLNEVGSMCQLSGAGGVVGVIGIDEGVGTTTIAAALAVHADAEEVDTLLVTDGPSHSGNARTESSERHISDESLANPQRFISDRVHYPNAGTLKQLSVDDRVGLHSNGLREELSRWMRMENELTIVDLPRQATKNSIDAQMLDCVVIVAQAEKSTSVDLRRCLRRLDAQGVPVAAVILNKTHRAIPGWIERLVS